jgi:hypothetical protein
LLLWIYAQESGSLVAGRDYLTKANTIIGESMMRAMTNAGIKQQPPVARLSFLWRPYLVVGIPVDLAILYFALEIPSALFVENLLIKSPPIISN